jgi:hypothetical protein
LINIQSVQEVFVLDSKVMEFRLKQWIPLLEEQAKSGLNKQDWCEQNGIKRAEFFKWQKELRKYLLEKNENKLQAELPTELVVQTATKFVELTPVSSSIQSNLNNSPVSSRDVTPVSSISIRCGEFSIDLNDDVNELLLSKVLKAIADVH